MPQCTNHVLIVLVVIDHSLQMDHLSEERSRELVEENRQLRHAVEELSVLNELARTIAGSEGTERLVHTILSRSVAALGAEQGLVTLAPVNDESVMTTYIRAGGTITSGHKFDFSDALLGWMQLYMRPLLISDPRSDERFRGVAWDENVRSILSVPMMVAGRLIAVLTVFNKKEATGFTNDDQRLLAIIASQSAQVVENARLREQEVELLQWRHEIQLASVIQQNLLPKGIPTLPGYDIAGKINELGMVGGDFFDFVQRPDGCWAISLGDVCGKGLGASLLMSNAQAMFRTHAVSNTPPEECLKVASRLLYQSTDTDKYITIVYAVLDPLEHILRYTNGGHTKPILVRGDGTCSRLEHRELMLGLTEEFTFTSVPLELAPGDTVTIFSDGITEAVNAVGEEFSEKRIEELLVEMREETAERIVDRIISEVGAYCGDLPQQDDISVVVVKRRNS